MSTTVTYKGQTLTTVENQTKTLQTAGTWVEGDFTLTDVSGGGGGNEDDIIERNSINLTNTTVTKVGRSALSHMPVTGLYLPNVTTVADNGFDGMTGLTTLTDANLPNLSGGVGSTAFGNITSLQTVNLTSALDFYSNTYAFRGCTNLTDARFPNARTSQSSTGQTQRTFYGCSKLAICDLGKVRGVGISTFQSCTLLRTLILRSETVASLQGWNANALGGIFSNPTASTIYVPSALVSSYQTASNWSSAYSAGVTFAPIEGSEYEL